ncbi:DUF2690 domain-containing protein [Streptomyces sp. NPDC127584]|uniref:helix-turn-helix domain-containing protein n=1 Tax=Streptomyces sp. NPDC127584 TaxID=3345403 RepID=UPI00362DD41F
MPGWKALPDELDPDVRAFTERLRRLIERSGLGVTAVAERTGRERSAWDAYLNARRPAPRSAVVALAEVTGSDPAGLAADWERAERAWARTAPGAGDGKAVAGAGTSRGGDGRAAGPVDGDGGHRDRPEAPDQTLQIRRIDLPDRTAAPPSAKAVGDPGSSGAARTPGVPGPAGEVRGQGGPGSVGEARAAGLAGEARGPDSAWGTRTPGSTSEPRIPGALGSTSEPRTPGAPGSSGEPRIPGAPGPAGEPRTPARAPHGDPAFTAPRPAAVVPPPRAPGPAPARTPDSPRRKVLLYVTGIVGALLVVTAALLLVDLGGSEGPDGDDRAAAPTTTTTAPPTTRPAELPPGVRCAGPDCTGQDPEAMGCGGPLATTVARAVVGGATVEVRHSETCGASWARLTGGAPQDTVTIRVGEAERSATVAEGADTVATGTDAYTPMVAVPADTTAEACGLLADGREGCTTSP